VVVVMMMVAVVCCSHGWIPRGAGSSRLW